MNEEEFFRGPSVTLFYPHGGQSKIMEVVSKVHKDSDNLRDIVNG